MGCFFFSFKQKTAYEIRISDWSSDVCSSDLRGDGGAARDPLGEGGSHNRSRNRRRAGRDGGPAADHASPGCRPVGSRISDDPVRPSETRMVRQSRQSLGAGARLRAEENTSTLQSLMRYSYAVFRLKTTNQSS